MNVGKCAQLNMDLLQKCMYVFTLKTHQFYEWDSNYIIKGATE